MLTPNLYLGIEASLTDYDSISATRAARTTPTRDAVNVSADAKVAQGTITLGYKF